MTRIIAGRRPVLEAIRSKVKIRRLLLEPDKRLPELRDAAQRHHIRIEEKSRSDLDGLTEGVRHQGVVAVADDYVYRALEQVLEQAGHPPVLVALDEITDPQNVGAIIRSAVAFGLDGVILQKHRAAGVTAGVVRASAGATEHASIVQVTNLQKTLLALKDQGFEVLGLDAGGDIELRTIAPTDVGRVLVVGSEGRGLRRMVRQRCDIVVQIKQRGPMDSLNASVAAALAMYHVARQDGTQ